MDTLTVNVDRVLSIGQPARISMEVSIGKPWADPHEIGGVLSYATLIEDLMPDSVGVSWPAEGEAQVPTDLGQRVTLRIPYDRGVLVLDSNVAASSLDPVPMLYIARSGDWSRTQMRLHVRLYVGIVPYEALVVLSKRGEGSERLINNVDAALNALNSGLLRGEPFGATIQNLSAGGMLLASTRPLEHGNLLKVKFPLARSHPDIMAFAKVVWVEDEVERIGNLYRAGCQFINLGAKQQDIITKFIFAKEVEARQRGLL